MPQKAEHTVYILEGKAILYKRAGTPHWQVRYKAGGKWLRSTTKQADLDEAKSVATELIMNAWFRAKNDMPIVNKRFKAVANIAPVGHFKFPHLWPGKFPRAGWVNYQSSVPSRTRRAAASLSR